MNAVVLVLAECHMQWQRTSGGIYFIAMYWELTMLCHFKLIKDRQNADTQTDILNTLVFFCNGSTNNAVVDCRDTVEG